MDNYLITGYRGEPHVTVENDRGINAGIVGGGRFVLPVGEQFRTEYIGNNTVRMYDGKLMDNGAAAGIPAGEYMDFVFQNSSQGMNRNDLIVFAYYRDPSTLIERGQFHVVMGAETRGTAVDPDIFQEDLLSDKATYDYMPLWRVRVSTGTISQPEQIFEVSTSLTGIKTVAEGGTGLGEIGVGNFLIGNGKKPIAEATPQKVLEMINGVSKEEIFEQGFATWEELQKSSFLTMQHLWENASSGTFASQTLTINGLNNYPLLMIVTPNCVFLVPNTGGDTAMSVILPVSETNIYACARYVQVTGNNTIMFSDCRGAYLQSNVTEIINDVLIPIDICGIAWGY